MIQGDDLAVAVVRSGVELTKPNASVLRRGVVEGFLALDAAQRRDGLAPFAAAGGDGAAICLTIPSAWCAMHPIAVTCLQWDSARTEIVRSIDRMLPLSPESAEVGLVDLVAGSAGPNDPAISGMLIGADRSRIDPWSLAIAEALGRPIGSVRSPLIAALGLGLQHDERAAVVEPDGSAHLLRWGRITSVDTAGPDGVPAISLVDDADDEASGPQAVAVAAALADLVAPGAFRPITGAAPAQPRRWLAPAACALLAVALLLLAMNTGQRRYDNAIEEERQRQAALADELAETQRLRLETERLTKLLNDGVRATAARWRAITPALLEAQSSIPEDGTLHRLGLDGEAVAFRGETRDAGAVLGALEASSVFTGAAFTAPVSKSPDGSDIFELRAERLPVGSGGASE